ncbi:MAG: hypothetical protein M3401_19160, partial [Actinomycetota bacterium]|nr:hypothetical protein [Actinomycetota bacterium]
MRQDLSPDMSKRLPTDTQLITCFISCSTPNVGEEREDLLGPLVAKADRMGRAAATPYRIETIEAPSDANSAATREQTHGHLACDASFAFIVLDRLSEGCMRIFSWAVKLGVPTFVLVLPGARESAMLGSAPGEG